MTETLAERSFTKEALPAPLGEPAWARTLREQALVTYEAHPMPSQETEEWRYTDISGLDLESFAAFAPGRAAASLDDVDAAILEALGTVGERSGLLVQHNSEAASDHLVPELAGQGVVFTSLDRAIAEHPELVEPHLYSTVAPDRTKLTALHAAFRTGGVFLYVPRGVRTEVPLQALTYLGADGAAIFPHTLIVAEEGAEVTFIDRYVSPPLERALSDAMVELVLGPAARVRYVGLQDYGTGVTHLSVQRAEIGPDAELRSLGVAFGASLARAEVEAMLTGDGGSSELLGIYFGDGDQHIDHRSIQDHVGARTSSDLLYKGAMRDRSAAIYTGTVIIEQGAHECDAYQTNRNILLSEDARAQSVPNLEILSNDPTRCGHAASVGPVDEDELFYLQTRGIPRDEAERLIVSGFFREVLDRVQLDEVREGVQAAIEAELR